MAKKIEKKEESKAAEKETKAIVKSNKTIESKKPTAEKKVEKTKAPVEAAIIEQEEAPVEEFASHCGMNFNPDVKSTCNTVCKRRQAKHFAACEQNFKEMLATKTTQKTRKATSTVERDEWGHKLGTRSHIVNTMLCQGASVDEMHSEVIKQTGKGERVSILNHIRWNSTQGRPTTTYTVKDPKTKKDITRYIFASHADQKKA